MIKLNGQNYPRIDRSISYDFVIMKLGDNMKWLNGIQESINYIEEHLDQEIDKELLASFLHTPYDSYQRIFTILCGVTPMQYIRFRRLSCAGVSLKEQDTSILTLALSYGYENAESFTKAFTRFHHVSPTQARTSDCALMTFTKINVSVTVKGATSLAYRIVELPAFQVQAIRHTFPNEQAVFRKEIPMFWQKFFQTNTYQAFCTIPDATNTNTHGKILGMDTIALSQEQISYLAAVETSQHIEGCETLTIPKHTWAVFTCHGQISNAIQALWTQIYEEFFPHPMYEPLIEVHFEAYDPTHKDQAEIYIPIKKKGS